MEIREQHNLVTLLMGAFALVNRCGGALIGLLIAAILLGIAQALLMWIGVPQLLVKLVNLFISAYFGVVLLRIFCAKAEHTDESVSNSLSASVFPTFYQIIFNLLYGAVWVVFILAAVFLFRNQLITLTNFAAASSSDYVSAVLILLAACAIPLYLGARLVYAPAAIALRDQGPVSAALYSFQMTSGLKFFTALGTILIILLLPVVYLAAVLYGGYTMIPLYFADSFNLAALSPIWWAVLAVLAIGYVFVLLSCPAFLTLVFLNQDYGFNRDSFTPQAELKITNRQTQVFGAGNNILPPGVGNLVRPEDLGGVRVTQSSVSTMPDDGVTEQHLQQVYKPKPEDLVQYKDEEDRMPTILFDDDMARQLEEERARWQQKHTQDKTKKGEDDAPSVKMSK